MLFTITFIKNENGIMNRIIKHLLILILLSVLSSLTASATTLIPLSLQQLSSRATLIFYARVISSRTDMDAQSGQIATFTEFKIIDLIKDKKNNQAGNTHTIKQLGGHNADTGTTLRVHGVPQFETGKKYVVFLPEKSSLGFCSPLGLQQGSFDVSTVDGENYVNNSHTLPEQTTQSNSINIPLAVRVDKPSHARLEDFINTIRAYNTP